MITFFHAVLSIAQGTWVIMTAVIITNIMPFAVRSSVRSLWVKGGGFGLAHAVYAIQRNASPCRDPGLPSMGLLSCMNASAYSMAKTRRRRFDFFHGGELLGLHCALSQPTGFSPSPLS